MLYYNCKNNLLSYTMSQLINLDKVISASKIQPEIFKIRRKLKSTKNPDYVAVMKGTTIEMVCLNKPAWDEYQSYKLGTQSKEPLKDSEISDGFSSIAGKDVLAQEPAMTKEEYEHYLSL